MSALTIRAVARYRHTRTDHWTSDLPLLQQDLIRTISSLYACIESYSNLATRFATATIPLHPPHIWAHQPVLPIRATTTKDTSHWPNRKPFILRQHKNSHAMFLRNIHPLPPLTLPSLYPFLTTRLSISHHTNRVKMATQQDNNNNNHDLRTPLGQPDPHTDSQSSPKISPTNQTPTPSEPTDEKIADEQETETTQHWEIITAPEDTPPTTTATTCQSNGGWSSDFALYVGWGSWKTKVLGWHVGYRYEREGGGSGGGGGGRS